MCQCEVRANKNRTKKAPLFKHGPAQVYVDKKKIIIIKYLLKLVTHMELSLFKSPTIV